MTWSGALRLGRVSNLPTVWTNALAGMVLADGVFGPATLTLVLAAVSLAYVGGMFLNDAFDADVDARERPERPIPAGNVSRHAVFNSGFAMLAASVLGLAAAGIVSGTGFWPAVAGLALACAILIYDVWHKGNPLSPVLMGLCRLLVYVAAALCVSPAPPAVLWIGAALLLCHIIGLTYAAKQESLGRLASLWPLLFLAAPLVYGLLLSALVPSSTFFWLGLLAAVAAALVLLMRRRAGDTPRAVATLIAAISLLDAMLIAGQGRVILAIVVALSFPLTLVLQRFIRGT